MKDALKIETVAFSALSDEDIAAWSNIRRSNPALESPYHHPDYHALVEHHQGGVKVTIAKSNGIAVAFLPWQGGSFARASGAPLSDYQAIIASPQIALSLSNFLKGQGIGSFHYTAMPHEKGQATCRLELDNAEHWRAKQGGSYRRHLKSTRRRIRKSDDNIGVAKVVTQSRDIDAYQALMRWKAEKFQETGKFDVLSNMQNSGLLRTLWERGPHATIRADLHVLYFGDRIAACDLGLTDGHVFHSWIVGYDSEFLTYAPGIQLLEGLMDEAAQCGYGVIDLGPGTEGYKRHYATHPHHVASGLVTLPSAAGALASTYHRLETALENRTGDALGKLRRRYSQIAACEPRFSRRTAAMAKAIQYEMTRHPS